MHALKKLSLLIIPLSILVMLLSCDGGMKKRSTGQRYIEDIHTFLRLTAYTGSQKEFDLLEQVANDIIDEYASKLSVYVEGGEAYTINRREGTEPVSISDSLEELISTTLRYGEITDGAFDITVKPVFDLWEFGERVGEYYEQGQESNLDPPTPEQIEEKLELVDYRKVNLKDGLISFAEPDMEILLGGIAKGYILDKMRKALIDEGLKSGLVEAGGDVIIFNSKPDGSKWRIAMRNPRPDDPNMPHLPGNQNLIYGLELENSCVVTSGDYQQYYIDSTGKRRHHIIDPKTGYPAEPVISATVISSSIIEADILSTGIMVMGVDAGNDLIEGIEGVESCIIYTTSDGNYEIKTSSGFNEYVSIEPEMVNDD